MGCLQSATAVRHAYPSSCTYFFAKNNFQKQLPMFAIKFCRNYLTLSIGMLHEAFLFCTAV